MELDREMALATYKMMLLHFVVIVIIVIVDIDPDPDPDPLVDIENSVGTVPCFPKWGHYICFSVNPLDVNLA